jgi:hypothetical protein
MITDVLKHISPPSHPGRNQKMNSPSYIKHLTKFTPSYRNLGILETCLLANSSLPPLVNAVPTATVKINTVFEAIYTVKKWTEPLLIKENRWVFDLF